MRRLAAELLGTFALVFAGSRAIVINDMSGGTVSHVGVALTARRRPTMKAVTGEPLKPRRSRLGRLT
jgi:hypothetical protein